MQLATRNNYFATRDLLFHVNLKLKFYQRILLFSRSELLKLTIK